MMNKHPQQPESLTHEALQRYSRQILIPEFGLEGQKRLARTSVLVIGAGGLGSAVLPFIVGAGFGRVGIAEFDLVDRSNLHRQPLYASDDLGRSKLEVALERLSKLNPLVVLEGHEQFTPQTALEMLRDYDLVIDASDNPETRLCVSDACSQSNRPWIWGAAEGTTGMVSVFDAQFTLRDAFPEFAPETNCTTRGVLGPLVGVIGSMMAGEAMKHALGLETLYKKLWIFESLEARISVIKLRSI